MGRTIISGNGKHFMKSVITWTIMLVTDILMLVFGFWLRLEHAPSLPWQARQQAEMMENLGLFLIILGIAGIFIASFVIISSWLSSKSNIAVYEGGIKGNALMGSFGPVQEFNVAYSDIKNVDVIKKTGVVLHTEYTKYTCHAKNANEIRDKIMERVKQAGKATQD